MTLNIPPVIQELALSKNNMDILIAALKGNDIKNALKTLSKLELVNAGLDAYELSVVVDVSNELEQLIRDGSSLAEALIIMKNKGWLTHIKASKKMADKRK